MIDIVPEYRWNMDDAPRPIAAMAKTWAAGKRIPLHIRRRGQLLHAVSGIMRIETAEAAWIVPPARALWLPPEMPHSIVMRSRLDMRTIYIDRAACEALHAYPVCYQSCYRVSPLAAVECLVGRCRGMCRNSQDRVECRHWIEPPVEAKHKFVEVSL